MNHEATNNDSNITCGACTVAIGAHTRRDNCRLESLEAKTVAVYHLSALTEDERKKLNGPDGGWDSSERFSRYANITSNAKKIDVIEAWKKGEFEKAAIVTTGDFDRAFERTNSIVDHWSDNFDAETVGDFRNRRSTSVGDIMVHSDGKAVIVSPVGFEEIDLGTPTHFFATCAFGWSTSEISREDALEKLAKRFRPDCQSVIRNTKKETGNAGMYFWSCVVDVPSTMGYGIEWYQPVGVPTSNHKEHDLTRVTLKAVEFVPFKKDGES